MPGDGFPVEVVEGVPVVAAPEEIDITNAEPLRSALLNAAANGHRTLVVDMTRTRFCDCSGLHTLLAAHKRAEAEGGEVLLVMAGPAVLRVFALTGADRMIPHFTSLPGALAHTGRRDYQPGPAREPITPGAGDGTRRSAAAAV
jgi:anti-sigma B factor antagonist